MATVWAVCKDPGGTINLLPVLPILREMGCDVKIFLHEGGKGESVIKAAGENFNVLADPIKAQFFRLIKLPNLLITSMCSGGGIGRMLISAFRSDGVPTVALQDFWGARLKTDWADPEYHPDIICVNDGVGKGLVFENWDVETRVAVTGYPSLDALSRINREEGAKVGREKLGITDDLPIVFYPGQIWHAGRTLYEVVTILNRLNARCHLVASKHSRMGEAPEEEQFWFLAQEKFRGTFHLFTDFRYVREVVLSSKVVVGMYSSLQIEAAALGIPVVSVLYPEYGAYQFRKETGGVMYEFPLVTLGCSTIARTPRLLAYNLDKALTSDLGLRANQERVFRLDGRNAERVAWAALSLLG